MIDRLAESIVRHRGRWTLVALVLLLTAGLVGRRLSLRHDATDFLPRGTALREQSSAGDARGDRLVVLLEGSSPLQAADVGPVLDSLAARLATLPDVRTVEHRVDAEVERFIAEHAPDHLLLYFDSLELAAIGERLSRRHMERALLGAHGGVRRSTAERLLGVDRTDPLGVVGPAQRLLANASGTPRIRIVDGYFASPDQRLYFLTLEPSRRLDDIRAARALVGDVEGVLRRARTDPLLRGRLEGKNLLVLGRPVAYVHGTDLALRDIRRVTIAAGVVVLGLLLLLLRRPLAPTLMLGTVLYGLVLTTAAAYLLFGSVSLLGWLFIAALIGFGDEFALYIIAHYWLASDRSADRAQALASALKRPGPGILLGGLTSAAAFLSLAAVSYPVMWQLAWLSTLGLLFILAASFTVLPLALAYTEPGQGGASGWYRWVQPLHHVPQKGRTPWLFTWALLVGVSLWFARGIRFEPHPWKVVVRGLPETAELDRVQRKLGLSFTPFRMVSRGATAEEAVALDRAATQELARIQYRAGIAAIVSLSRWIPSQEQQRANLAYVERHREVFSPARFQRDLLAVASRMAQRDTSLLASYLPLVRRYLRAPQHEVTLETLQREGLASVVATHLERQDGEFIAITDVYLSRLPWEKGTVDRFTGAITEAASPALAGVQFTGDALRGATHASALRRNILSATGLALGLTLLVLVVRFRRLSRVLLCLLPLACGVSVALGVMGLLGIELNVLTLAVAPLLVGLGSDDGIHIVDRLDRGEGLGQVLEEASTPMAITTVTTIAAFACLGFATFPGIRELGLVASLGLVVCLVASLRLVPTCWELGQRKKGQGEAKPIAPGP